MPGAGTSQIASRDKFTFHVASIQPPRPSCLSIAGGPLRLVPAVSCHWSGGRLPLQLKLPSCTGNHMVLSRGAALPWRHTFSALFCRHKGGQFSSCSLPSFCQLTLCTALRSFNFSCTVRPGHVAGSQCSQTSPTSTHITLPSQRSAARRQLSPRTCYSTPLLGTQIRYRELISAMCVRQPSRG